MTEICGRALNFLAANGLHVDGLDLNSLVDVFIREMEQGLDGKPSTLAMIPTYITIDRPVSPNRPVIVMDAGGTNLRVASVCFSEKGTPEISNFQKFSMPGIESEVGRVEFFDALADYLEPVMNVSGKVGFCFSYATEITPDCDGKLLHWTKEIRAPEIVGTYIGAGLQERLKARGRQQKRIVILNDTIATLLAGKSFGSARQYESYTGVILGTGTNTAYVESNAKITKKNDLDPNGFMAINLESGGFGCCPRSKFDLAYDRTTANPGKQILEKMIAGGYMGGAGLHVLKMAAENGLFSASAAAVIGSWSELSTKAMDDFLWNPYSDVPFNSPEFSDADRRMVFYLCREVVRRGAALAAVNIGAPIIKTGAGTDPLHPVCITVDGSTYYKTNNLKSMVEEHLRRLLGGRGIHYEIIKVEEAPMIGAAVAGLTV